MPTPKTWTDRAADILLDERNKRYLGMTEPTNPGASADAPVTAAGRALLERLDDPEWRCVHWHEVAYTLQQRIIAIETEARDADAFDEAYQIGRAEAEGLRAAATEWHNALRDGYLRGQGSCACMRGDGTLCSLGAALAAKGSGSRWDHLDDCTDPEGRAAAEAHVLSIEPRDPEPTPPASERWEPSAIYPDTEVRRPIHGVAEYRPATDTSASDQEAEE